MRNLAIGAALLGLAACSTAPAVVAPTPAVATGAISSNPVVSRSVASAEQALTLAFRAALVYTELPRCGATSARVCSDRATVRAIRDRAIQAHEAIVAARANEALASAAWEAVTAFQALLPKS